jgi:RNA polymerase sigma factor for flagellar operon FliA
VSVADSPEVLARFHSELALVDAIAAHVLRTVGRTIELDDLVGAGREGLLDAARRFDTERGIPFGAYASFRVRGAVFDAVRQLSRLPRRAYERIAALEAAAQVSEGEAEHAFASAADTDPKAARRALKEHLSSVALAAAIGMATETHGEVSDGDHSPEEALARAELMHIVRGAITELDADEEQIVRRHYIEGEHIEDIARDLEMSKSWASRLHTRAIGRLAKRLRGIAD